MSDKNPYAPPSADVEVETEMESELAGRWARLGGALVDGIILLVAVFSIMNPMGYWDRAMADALTFSDNVTMFVLYMVLYLAINGYTLSTRGQSVGKIVAGTRIVSYTDGRLLPLWKLFVKRYLSVSLLGAIPVIGIFLTLINILLIFGNEKRCGHDYIAGTRVIKANSLPAKA